VNQESALKLFKLNFLMKKMGSGSVVTSAYTSYKAAVIRYRALPNKYLFTIFKIQQSFNIFQLHNSSAYM
jgi:hypothetical protein